jgi:gliding motility associated protien GldN
MTNLLFVRAVLPLGCLAGGLLFATLAVAQGSETSSLTPLDDITERTVVANHRTLAYQPIREADIMWEKRIWRLVDVREKMNQSFTAPESPLFKIIFEAALAAELPVYSTENDRFTTRLDIEQIKSKLFKTDTILTIDIDTEMEIVKVVQNEISWEDVKRFRIKESWFFDAKTATLRHRILGIAPLLEVRDENGDFKLEMPLFWVHYPSSRELLARHKAITHGDNWASTTTWEDMFEMRYFSSMIVKENNVGDLRLQDMYSGRDMVLNAEKIEDALFNLEHDMWTW